MADEARPSADEVMAVAAREFLGVARAALDTFDRVALDLATRPDAEDVLAPFRRELHRLNGSAATFGFARAGRMASAMEAVVRKWLDASDLDRERRSALVGTFARTFRAQFADGAGAPGMPGKRLLVVGTRDALAAALTTVAAARGYLVERVADAGDIDDALADGAPYGMIAMAPAPLHDLLRGAVTIELYTDDIDGTARSPGDLAGTDRHRLPAGTDCVSILDALDALATAERGAGGGILVLDDDPVMRTIVGVAAAQVNLGVTAVDDVDAFRSALAAEAPAVIVMDIEIGQANGLDLVREVRAQPAYLAVPILVLSGHRDDATRQAALDAGAADYLLKPVSLPVLAAKLAAWHARGARGARGAR